MFTPLRRCPTSIRWRLISTKAAQSSPLAASQTARKPSIPSTTVILPSTYRTFSSTLHFSRNATATEPAIEAEEEYEAKADQPAATPALITKFADLDGAGLIEPTVVRTLTQKMKLETMTEVQSRTLNEALKGKDVLAQAKTGTGKTLAFLLPVLQNILNEDPTLLKKSLRKPSYGQRAGDIRAIIISPTRELAEQIGEEARKLTQDTGVVIQTAVGGTQKSFHLRAMQREGCHILVGTPGRLKDIFSDRETGVSAPKLSAFVMDEADRLLDAGFWPEIQAIQDLLPSKQEKDRQTLMFSATISQDVVKLVRSVMKPDLHYVRTVQENEEPTHERVPQRLVTVPSLENLLPTVLELCQRNVDANGKDSSTRPFKAIVYFNATAETTLASSIFMSIRRGASTSSPSGPPHTRAAASFNGTHLTDTRVYEIHSRLSQSQRTAAADHFRHCVSGILMSSDVTARGMDFPGVTHVIQVGLPNDREVYIHRLGRTARAGQEGEGWLIIPTSHLNEQRRRLGRMPLVRDTSLTASLVDLSTSVAGSGSGDDSTAMTPAAHEFFTAVSTAARRAVDPEAATSAYMALIGTHQWMKDKESLINMMNRLAKVQWGMEEPPAVARGLALKMALLGIPGLNIAGGARAGNRDFGGRPKRFGDAEGERERGGRGGPPDGGRGGSRFGADRPPFSRGGDRGGRPDRGGGDRFPNRFNDRDERGGGRFGDRDDRRGGRFGDRDERGGGGDRRGRSDDRGRGRPRDRDEPRYQSSI